MKGLEKIFTEMLNHIDDHKEAYNNDKQWTNQAIVKTWINNSESELKKLGICGVSGSAFVIINKGKVYENILFTSQEEARNFIKMKYPKRNFKEPIENVLVCAYYGTKFIIEEQHYR